MSEINIDIRGLAETQRAIYQFSERLGDRVTMLALRTGAKMILQKVRAAAPVKTGRLKRATVVANSRIHQRRRNGKVGVYLRVKPGRSRSDMKGAWYGKFVENGYKRGQTQVPGRKFVRNTFDANKQAALDLILAAIETGGRQLLGEINRR